MIGKHERATLDGLRARAAGLCVDAMPAAIRDAASDVLLAEALIPALQASGVLVLALEDLAAEAEAAAKGLRHGLAEAMASGATSVSLPHHTMALVEARPKAVITDPAAIPAEFLAPQPPKPDMHAIAKALKSGPVAGATMTNGGAPHVRIAPRKEAAA